MNVKSKIQCLFGGKHTSLFEGIILQICTIFWPLHDALKCAKLQRLSLRVNIFLIQLYFQK